jgi:hypothetical protein
VYPAWVTVQSIIKFKVDQLIRLSASLDDLLLNQGNLRLCVHNLDLRPKRMDELCPICFGPESTSAFVCLDGNFQVTTLGTKLEKRDGVALQDLDDKRIFVVEKEPLPQVSAESV